MEYRTLKENVVSEQHPLTPKDARMEKPGGK